MAATYQPSKTGWAKIALSPEILAACVAEAERGKQFAIAISPRSDDDVGKPYADSFDVEPTVVAHFRAGPRVAALLVNTAPHAAAVEFGNRRTPRPHRVLGRTAAFLGS